MDLKQLRTFITVAEQGSVSKAAARLRIAQPALSRQIINLEKDIGLNLFDRVGRRLALSKEGKEMLGACRSLLGQAALLAQQAQILRGGDTGSLKIAASPQILESVLSKFLLRYAASYPQVKVSLAEAVGRDQLMMLERGDADLAIGLLEAVRNEDHFATHELMGVEILAACHPKLRLGTRGTAEISQVAHHPLLVLDSTYAFRRRFDHACRLAGIEPNIVLESRAPHTLLALAEGAYGVAIIQSAVPIDRYKLRVVRVTQRRKPIVVPMAAIWDKRRNLPPYVADFYKLLGEYVGEVFPISQPSTR